VPGGKRRRGLIYDTIVNKREERDPKIGWLEERGDREDTQAEEIRLRANARKRDNGMGWADEGNSDMARAAREARRGENSRLLTEASNSKGLLTRARSEAGRGPACVPHWRHAGERERERERERLNGMEKRRGRPLHTQSPDTARISQQRCPNRAP